MNHAELPDPMTMATPSPPQAPGLDERPLEQLVQQPVAYQVTQRPPGRRSPVSASSAC